MLRWKVNLFSACNLKIEGQGLAWFKHTEIEIILNCCTVGIFLISVLKVVCEVGRWPLGKMYQHQQWDFLTIIASRDVLF